MKILLTGGLGYIGSHACIELYEAGYEVVIVDNLSNSSVETLKRIEGIVGHRITFYNLDIRNRAKLEKVFKDNIFHGVLHFAGLKAVSESINNPLDYYSNNINGSITLIDVMMQFNCKTFIFSSSATVYGKPKSVPINENFPVSSSNPYGYSKLTIENLLHDIVKSDKSWSIAILRYFNPIGAHKSGLIGENPIGRPNNLIPFLSQVAIGKRKALEVFGDDYDTIDGTGVRDYIHVLDLARGHLKALQTIKNKAQIVTLNLGTGSGYSVLEVVRAFEKASGKKISIRITERRKGDVSECYANATLAEKVIDWKAEYQLNEMCEDYWYWQLQNPNGY
jgi:UDP-glucose 4-epimerase